MKNKWLSIPAILAALFICVAASSQEGCGNAQESASGVTAVTQRVHTGADGLTIEQRNVKSRLEQDNKPGAIQHLYVISAYSGQVLIYSTVRGKVTSSSKRLMPSEADSGHLNFRIAALGDVYTNEILGDDGTYGSSYPYIYWWDSAGIYHQHYVEGGQIVHVSSAPLAVKSIILNMETRSGE